MDPAAAPEVMTQLNKRETSTYITRKVTFYPKDSNIAPFMALVYVGTETSSGFLGPASLQDMAEQIVQSRGKSGANSEYVLKLASIVREIAPHVRDEHLFILEEKVLDLLKNEECQRNEDPEQNCTK